METEDEQRPTGETAFGGQSGDDLSWQTTDAKAHIHTDRIASAVNSATPTQRITPFTDDIRPQPGSNVERIYGLSDCVIAVAFTLIVVNIKLPPAGLSESQLQSFVLHDILPNVPFYLVSYIIFASSWISHYRIFTYLKRSSSLFILLNVLFLASIVFLPVPVAFFFYYGNQAGSLQLFACTQLVTSVALLLMQSHSTTSGSQRASFSAFSSWGGSCAASTIATTPGRTTRKGPRACARSQTT